MIQTKNIDSFRAKMIEMITSVIDSISDSNRHVDPNKVSEILCSEHANEIVENSPFTVWNVRANVRNMVGKVIAEKFKDRYEEDTDNQLKIEGFQQLQKYYIVNRDDVDIAVPIDDMYPNEVKARVKKLRKMGDACYVHAAELEGYHNNKI